MMHGGALAPQAEIRSLRVRLITATLGAARGRASIDKCTVYTYGQS